MAVALGWLIWAALFHSQPAVAAQVSSYTVVSDTLIEVTLTVDRRDPTQPVTCRVLAQAADHSAVGEQQVGVPATTARGGEPEAEPGDPAPGLTATAQGLHRRLTRSRFPGFARR